jgi:hypothetical protein
LLIETVEGTGEWRIQKAEDHPEDGKRNLGAFKDLLALASSLRSIADNDPLWLGYARAVESDNDAVLITEWVSEQLRYIGFQTSAPDGSEFLRELLKEMTQEAL